MALKAPMPWFGGKSTVAPLVWERFGSVANYVEPFFGSGAVLLANPCPPSTETVNDLDGLLVNFWRALRADPDAVAYWADYPVSEIDLHSVHLWLLACKPEIERLIADPDWFDAQAAGRWVWGLCAWIGSGWCSGRGPWRLVDGVLTKGEDDGELLGDAKQLPHLGNAGQGIERKRPHLMHRGKGVHAPGIARQLPHLMHRGKGVHAPGIARQLPHLGDGGRGVAAPARGDLYAYLGALSERLQRVRITCGDWSRVVGPSVTTKHGMTAVLLDPPYSHDERKTDLYNRDRDIAGDVRAWAIANGADPLLRIALCGYKGEHEMPADWECIPWKAKGGYGSQGDGRGRANAGRECIWFSRHCVAPRVQQRALFEVPA